MQPDVAIIDAVKVNYIDLKVLNIYFYYYYYFTSAERLKESQI